jgi:hypothetical protein
MSLQKRPSRPIVMLGKMLLFAHERMSKALGPKRAEEVLRSALSQFGERSIETPQDLLELSKLLLGAGGLVKAVGESLKQQALLRGATEQ